VNPGSVTVTLFLHPIFGAGAGLLRVEQVGHLPQVLGRGDELDGGGDVHALAS
jgi:hypothetical protein